MKKAKLIKTIMVTDPDGVDCELTLYQHENGWLFAVDSVFLDNACDEDSYPVIPDLYNENHSFEGSQYLMLVEDNKITNFINSVDLPQD